MRLAKSGHTCASCTCLGRLLLLAHLQLTDALPFQLHTSCDGTRVQAARILPAVSVPRLPRPCSVRCSACNGTAKLTSRLQEWLNFPTRYGNVHDHAEHARTVSISSFKVTCDRPDTHGRDENEQQQLWKSINLGKVKRHSRARWCAILQHGCRIGVQPSVTVRLLLP